MPRDPLSQSGRVALVTGAARGIGRAIAAKLADHGAAVVVVDLPDASGLLAGFVAEIEAKGGRARHVAADISRRSDVVGAIATAIEAFGRLDILVNNAGVHSYPQPLLTVTEPEWDRLFAINLKGALFACQAAVPHMKAQGSGVVINIASDSAFDVIADEGGYGITKIAVVRMAAYLARELVGTGVRVNSVAPGWVRTRLTAGFLTDAETERTLLQAVPAQRVAEPDDIAGVVLFLASELASYVNGHCIVVDGGRIAGIPA